MKSGLGLDNRNGGETPPHFLQHLCLVGIMIELSLTFPSSSGDRNGKGCLCWSFPNIPQLLQTFAHLHPPGWALWPAPRNNGYFLFHHAYRVPFQLNVRFFPFPGINQDLLLQEMRPGKKKVSQPQLTISDHSWLLCVFFGSSGRITAIKC